MNSTETEREPKNLQQTLNKIREKNPHQTEFIQAVEEVSSSIEAFLTQHPNHLKDKLLERICEPERIIIFRVPWIDDEGSVQVNRGYRVQMNSALGPYKGGTRFHPTVNLSILKFLAFEQIFKNSLTGLPLGAGKGGSDFDPKGKSDHEILKLCQSFMTELSRHIGEDTDIPAGDIGVGSREVGYMFGQYKRLTNNFHGVLTGKSMEYGGIRLRPEATGYGNCFFAREMLTQRDETIEGKKCLISGSGNVALYTAEKLLDLGAQVLTLSDSNGFIYDKDGINKDKLAFLKQLKFEKQGRIKEYADQYGCEFHADQKPWSVPGDLAFPSATQNELDVDDARQLIENECTLVSEGANMPCTSEAVKALIEAGVLFGPGKAANAGGVAVSGLEMSQNATGLPWSQERVLQELESIMNSIHEKCLEYGSTDQGIDYVKGANLAGYVRVAEAMIAQGVV